VVGTVVGGIIGGYFGNKSVSEYIRKRNNKKAADIVNRLEEV
jgi:Na+/glutamate symporter